MTGPLRLLTRAENIVTVVVPFCRGGRQNYAPNNLEAVQENRARMDTYDPWLSWDGEEGTRTHLGVQLLEG